MSDDGQITLAPFERYELFPSADPYRRSENPMPIPEQPLDVPHSDPPPLKKEPDKPMSKQKPADALDFEFNLNILYQLSESGPLRQDMGIDWDELKKFELALKLQQLGFQDANPIYDGLKAVKEASIEVARIKRNKKATMNELDEAESQLWTLCYSTKRKAVELYVAFDLIIESRFDSLLKNTAHTSDLLTRLIDSRIEQFYEKKAEEDCTLTAELKEVDPASILVIGNPLVKVLIPRTKTKIFSLSKEEHEAIYAHLSRPESTPAENLSEGISSIMSQFLETPYARALLKEMANDEADPDTD